MAKAQAWVPLSTAIDFLAEAWGREEAISELFHSLADGVVEVQSAFWNTNFDFNGLWISTEEIDQVQNGAKSEFWRFMRDKMLGGPSDGIIRRQSLNRGIFDVTIRYGSAAEAHHAISGLMLRLEGVRDLLKSTSSAASSHPRNSTQQQAAQKTIGERTLISFVQRLPIDTEINRSDVLERAKKEFPENHVPRKMVRDAVYAEFGPGTPGPKKRPN